MDKIIVQTPSLFKVDQSFDEDRFMRVRIAVMHSGENRNKSSFDTKVIKAAKDTFANIPILANVITYTDKDGNTVVDYGGHDMHIEQDAFDESKTRLIYDERVVGVIPENNNFEIVHDDESDRDYVYVDGLLYREYGNYACDVLESRNNRTDVSAEIYCDEISYDANTQILVVNEMRMSGVTLLGADVTPAMQGAHAETFSISDDNRQSQLVEIMKELTESLNNYTAAIQAGKEKSKEGGMVKVDKFNELLAQYNISEEDVTFEYEGLSDEELEAKFAEVFASEGDNADPEPEPEGDSEPEGEPESEEDFEVETNSVNYSVEHNGTTHTYSVSLQDKISALYNLVNDTYADGDTWYDVTVYDDEKYVIMIDYWHDKGYKQSYKVKKDVYTLIGDRVEVFARWLTQDEINSLEKMKSDYAVISEKLGKYEAEPEKMKVLESDDYSLIAEDEDFVALKNDHFDMSLEDVTKRADEILTNAAKAHKFSFATNTNGGNGVKPLPPMNKKPQKRFGSLFDGIV